ncbi:MAG: translation initiation factor IF-1 [Wolbachia sp.]|uniref:translation initiation factor IF-1 n=1 Tax=Wolbachia endosymbiont of Tettigetta isshikii TaxID=3239093 RepID=UPI002450610E|nr:translation initiation factor IF-1 [Wolbachia endosymbiont of Melophagus ovinus]MDG7052769.1 translation initiation factor IF-1 [Wolbachia endosymbiont of Alcedoecus sp.]MDG7052854.1 translation initiation factor IF-1 [Wolbachia endosymbiont of Alcedoecus sp.]MDG7055283.1 translation initiation factor IF-1 [Wolbachia endosymbiont of Menacanthus eurysternus]
MVKDEKSKTIFEVEGVVTALLPAAEFRVKLDNEHEIICHVSGKVRRSKIRIVIGDRVLVEMSIYDRNAKKGRIIRRLKGTSDRTISR